MSLDSQLNPPLSTPTITTQSGVQAYNSLIHGIEIFASSVAVLAKATPMTNALIGVMTGPGMIAGDIATLAEKIGKGTATAQDWVNLTADIGQTTASFALCFGVVGATPELLTLATGAALLSALGEYGGPQAAQYMVDIQLQLSNASAYGFASPQSFPSGDPATGMPWGGDSLDSLINSLKTQFNQAEVTKSPIVLDLDGNGVTTTSVLDGTHFDLDGNGFAEQTGWVGHGDGLLVWDRNGNGEIDDGSELFGNYTKLTSGANAANGFEALAEMDTNHDGQVNALDTNANQLRVWRDDDADGITDAGELLTLQEAGVSSLATGYADVTNHFYDPSRGLYYRDSGSNFITDENRMHYADEMGNDHFQMGGFTRTDTVSYAGVNWGSGHMDDVWFTADEARTVDKNIIAVSQSVAAMPEIAAFGNVHSLRQAMPAKPHQLRLAEHHSVQAANDMAWRLTPLCANDGAYFLIA
jgi:hypothetical protein